MKRFIGWSGRDAAAEEVGELLGRLGRVVSDRDDAVLGLLGAPRSVRQRLDPDARATVGELIHHKESAGASVAWLLGAGAVLLPAHLFSDVLAHLASTRDDPTWSATLRISRTDVSVTFGFIGAALAMVIAGLTDLDTQGALYACVAVGLVAVAALSFYATANHRPLTRVLMGAAAAALGAVIVLGENAF